MYFALVTDIFVASIIYKKTEDEKKAVLNTSYFYNDKETSYFKLYKSRSLARMMPRGESCP